MLPENRNSGPKCFYQSKTLGDKYPSSVLSHSLNLLKTTKLSFSRKRFVLPCSVDKWNIIAWVRNSG